MIYFPPIIPLYPFEVENGKNIFLAGTIDNGNSIDWQEELGNELSKEGFNVFNPRNKNWNKELATVKDNITFFNQVNWEIECINRCDYVAFYFIKDSLSPITLLELGLTLGQKSDKVIVYCPKEFWRKGNVDIVCERFGVKVFEDEKEWKTTIINKIKKNEATKLY